MRANYFLLMLVCLFFACNKQDDTIPVDTKVTIGNESFIPNEGFAYTAGNKLIITFKKDEKKIIITTNDTVVGNYSVASLSLKSSLSLKANITYYDGNIAYEGNSGTFKIIKYEGNLISGTYDTKVSAANGNIIDLNSGSFVDIQSKPLIDTESAINDTLDLCYSKLSEYIEFSYLFDAVYSNEIQPPNSSWSEIYKHTQTYSPNEKITMLWSSAYDLIFKTNLILISSELVISDESSRKSINAQALAIRAYLFYNLMSWFGEIPLETGISESINRRGSITEVLAQIKEDATSSSQALPIKWSDDDKFRMPKSFMLGLLARIALTDFQLPDRWPPVQQYLYSGNYNEVILALEEIINSGNYQLNNELNSFTASDPEIIWGFQKKSNPEFNAIFTKGSYIPVLRLTEIYLLLSEAMLQVGKASDAITYSNQLNLRRGNSLVTSIAPNDIFLQWNRELSFEGSVFITLRRFNKALSIVQNSPMKILLPIPADALYRNPNLTQNIGY